MQITKRVAGAQPTTFGVSTNSHWRLHLRLRSLIMPNTRGALIGAAIGAGIAMGIGAVGVAVADVMDEMCLFQHGRSIAQAPGHHMR